MRAYIVAAAAGLAGCIAEEPLREPVVALLPEPAAVKIIQETLPTYDGGSALPLGRPVMIRSIRQIAHYSNDKLQAITDDIAGSCVSGVSLSDARAFTEALRSLGAPVELVRHSEPGLRTCTLNRPGSRG
jgi:hypothetical protein